MLFTWLSQLDHGEIKWDFKSTLTVYTCTFLAYIQATIRRWFETDNTVRTICHYCTIYRVMIILYRKGNDVDDLNFWKRYMLAVCIVCVLLLLIWNNWSLTVLLLVQFHYFVWFYYQFEIFIIMWTLCVFAYIHGYYRKGLVQGVDEVTIATHHEWSLASVESLLVTVQHSI